MNLRGTTSRGIRRLSLCQFVFEFEVLIFAQSRIHSNVVPENPELPNQ
jgi:hypothetical protein